MFRNFMDASQDPNFSEVSSNWWSFLYSVLIKQFHFQNPVSISFISLVLVDYFSTLVQLLEDQRSVGFKQI